MGMSGVSNLKVWAAFLMAALMAMVMAVSLVILALLSGGNAQACCKQKNVFR